jgi:hypothetical protein
VPIPRSLVVAKVRCITCFESGLRPACRPAEHKKE